MQKSDTACSNEEDTRPNKTKGERLREQCQNVVSEAGYVKWVTDPAWNV
jgi:hypothetical protein